MGNIYKYSSPPASGGGGVSGLTSADGGTALADNAIVRGDGTDGIQGSGVTIGDVSASNVTVTATTGNALTIATLDNNKNIALTPHGTGKVGVGLTNPYRAFSVNGRSSFGDGDQTQDALDSVLHIALNSTDASSETFDATVGWYGLSMSSVNGTGTLFAVGHKNGDGPVIGARQQDLLFGGISSSGTFTEYARFGTSGTAPAFRLLGFASTYGKNALASDFTNSTATMANLTGLSTTLVAGRKYTFRMALFVNDSVAGEGVAIDFDGGSATATTFRAHTKITDAALLTSSQTSALATDVTAATVTGDALIEVEGAFVVNAGGTFIPRAAQNSHSTGTLTVYAGSNIIIEDVSFN